MIDPQKVRAVIFDLDDTLRHNDPDGFNHFVAQVRSLGVEISEEQARAAKRWVHQYWATSEELLDDVRSFPDREEEFWLNYGMRQMKALGLAREVAEQHAPLLYTYMREEYQPENRLMPQALQTLRTLRSSGYLVGLLTNRTRPIHDDTIVMQLDLDLDFFLAAGQVGAFKPHRELFDQVLDFIDIPAEDVVYVGDNYYADILGAQSAGIQPVLLDPDKLYPEVECPVIGELPEVLALFQVQPVSRRTMQ